MRRRQTIPQQWLIVPDEIAVETLRALPLGTGVLLLQPPRPDQLRRLRQAATVRGLIIAQERSGVAARVHNMRELTQARMRRAPLILISPMYPTRSHPDWHPLPRMRAATLARLADRRAIALGGMDERRFGRVQRLGFVGWAGISCWLKIR